MFGITLFGYHEPELHAAIQKLREKPFPKTLPQARPGRYPECYHALHALKDENGEPKPAA